MSTDHTAFEVGDTVRVKKCIIGRLTALPCEDESVVGQLAIVTTKHVPDGRTYDASITARVLSNGKTLHHNWRDREYQSFELVAKGKGVCVPGVDYAFTEDELRGQRLSAFVDRIKAHDFRHEGFTNAATYLAALYLLNDGPTRPLLQGLRRKDGSLNPTRLERLFYQRKMTIDEWAYQCPVDTPAEFERYNIPQLHTRAGLRWQEVADHIAEVMP